jgi:general secretion pathway protein K
MILSVAKQRGMALLLVLLFVALLAVLMGNLAWRYSLALDAEQNSHDRAQAVQAVQAGLILAQYGLQLDAKNSSIDHAKEAWAAGLPSQKIEGGMITGKVSDAQSCFNLNNLLYAGEIQAANAAAYESLLKRENLPVELVNSLADWLDADSLVRFPGGAEDTDYLLFNPPYRAANAPLLSLQDLRQVKGYTPAILQHLAQANVCVLPQLSQWNLNFITAQQLQETWTDISLAEAEQIIESREKTGYFVSLSEAITRFPLTVQKTLEDATKHATFERLFSLRNQYFFVDIQVKYGVTTVNARALLERSSADTLPRVVWKTD